MTTPSTATVAAPGRAQVKTCPDCAAGVDSDGDTCLECDGTGRQLWRACPRCGDTGCAVPVPASGSVDPSATGQETPRHGRCNGSRPTLTSMVTFLADGFVPSSCCAADWASSGRALRADAYSRSLRAWTDGRSSMLSTTDSSRQCGQRPQPALPASGTWRGSPHCQAARSRPPLGVGMVTSRTAGSCTVLRLPTAVMARPMPRTPGLSRTGPAAGSQAAPIPGNRTTRRPAFGSGRSSHRGDSCGRLSTTQSSRLISANGG